MFCLLNNTTAYGSVNIIFKAVYLNGFFNHCFSRIWSSFPDQRSDDAFMNNINIHEKSETTSLKTLRGYKH